MARYIKGLSKSTSHIDQPEGTWRHAKNAVINKIDGGIQNEEGIEQKFRLTGSYILGAWEYIFRPTQAKELIIGKIETSDGRTVIFTVDESPQHNVSGFPPFEDMTTGISVIYVIDKNSITTVLRTHPFIYNEVLGSPPNPLLGANLNPNIDFNLKFNKNNPIEGTYKINYKGDLVVYWTDNLNPPRALNITRQLSFKDTYGPTFSLASFSYEDRIYGVDPTASPNNSYVDRLNLFPHSGPIPHIDPNKTIGGVTYPNLTAGGGLSTGVYQLALAYVDADFTPTNYLTVSNPVSVVNESESVTPIERYDGAPAGTGTGKAITWAIDNINTDYDYLRPAIIETINHAEKVYVLKDIPISAQSDVQIIFTGLEGFASSSIEDIMVDDVAYDTVKTIAQLDNVLYLGNLKGSKDVNYQAYANNIKLHARTKIISDFDPYELTPDSLMRGYSSASKPFSDIYDTGYYNITRGYRSSKYNVNHRGYTRDEVYAFYIAFILKDGSMTYAYHIPGREPILDNEELKYVQNSIPAQLDSWVSSLIDQSATINIPTDLDGDECPGTNDIETLPLDFVNITGGNMSDSDDSLYSMTTGTGQKFHFYEYSYEEWDTTNDTGPRNMNYWENKDEFYPNTEDYDILNAETAYYIPGSNGYAGSLQGKNVRHHHFPSNENTDFKTIATDNQGILPAEAPETVTVLRTVEFKGVTKHTNFDEDEFGYLWRTFWFGHSPAMEYAYTTNAFNNIFLDTLWGSSTVPAEGTCMWCQITSGYGSDTGGGEGTDAGCNAWFYGMVANVQNNVFGSILQGYSNFYAGVQDDVYAGKGVPLRTAYLSGNCPCNDIPNEFMGDNPCLPGMPDPTEVEDANNADGYLGCCDGGPDDDGVDTPWSGWYSNNISNITGQFTYNGATGPSAGVCKYYETIDNPIENTGYITRDVKILGFDLKSLKIPQSIADKVQGFRIYHAKRNHHNRRILGQNMVHPMQKKSTALPLCSQLLMGLSDNLFDAVQDPSTVDENELNREMWYKEAVIRYTGWYEADYESDVYNIRMCNFHGLFFSDFYLLNSHNSIAHATHIKTEYTLKTIPYRGTEGYKKTSNYYGVDPETGQFSLINSVYLDYYNADNYLKCELNGIYNSFHIAYAYDAAQIDGGETNSQSKILDLGGVLNRPIKENCKTYLRGDGIFEGASGLGFGMPISNEYGESTIALELDYHRGLPIIGTQNTACDDFYNKDSLGGDDGNQDEIFIPLPAVIPEIDGLCETDMYQINLHAFKLNMYNNIDTNELAWTGYEVLGDDLKKFVPGEEGTQTYDTTSVYPEGIFGGDTFICRHFWRSTHRPVVENHTSMSAGGGAHSFGDQRAAYSTIVESSDNINFRHQGEKASGADVASPATPIAKLLTPQNHIDLTFNRGDNTTGGIRYNEDYSKVNTIRTTIPVPTKDIDSDLFPTRIQKSAKSDPASLKDSFRTFLANDFKDLPKNRGDLWKITSFNNLLYFHMEDTLYQTKGKQTLELKDGSEAFVGSGDLFDKEPEEIFQTYYGYGGTRSQYANITTRWGYFFVDQVANKVFLLADSLIEVSELGMESWFRENIPYALEEFGLDPQITNYNLDNPRIGLGFHSTWDPENNRILLTKKDLEPTLYFKQLLTQGENTPPNNFFQTGLIEWDSDLQIFTSQEATGNKRTIDLSCGEKSVEASFGPNDYAFLNFPSTQEDCEALNTDPANTLNINYSYWDFWDTCYGLQINGVNLFECGGWTISFYPELQIWVSFHDYVPSVYILTGETLLSAKPSNYIGEADNLESNLYKHGSLDFGYFYTSGDYDDKNDTYDYGTRYPFTFEFIHNPHKDEAKTFFNIEYVVDVWKYNTNVTAGTQDFKKIKIHNKGFTTFYVYTSLQNSGEIDINDYGDGGDWNTRKIGNSWKINKFRDMSLLDTVSTGITETTSEETPMFIINGMNKEINEDYIDLTKAENKQQKFVDKFVGICLKNSNNKNNLVTLYSTNTGMRKYFR